MLRSIIRTALLSLFLVCFAACSDPVIPEPDLEPEGTSDPALSSSTLTGIWKLKAFRYGGGNLSKYKDLYAIADMVNADLALVSDYDDDEETGDPFFDLMKIVAQDDSLFIVSTNDYEGYLQNPNGDFKVIKMSYLMPDENELNIYVPFAELIEDESQKDGQVENFHLIFYRDTELEEDLLEEVSGTTKSFWSTLKDIAQTGTNLVKGGIKLAWREITGSKDINEYSITAADDYEPWENTNSWKPDSWMSHLRNTMPVAWVNIPGSHDSSTTKNNMNVLADFTDAWVQTYTIEEQYRKGARYFDFRVGSSLKRTDGGLYVRIMTTEEQKQVKDLQMYHGPICTNTPFIATMRTLANLVREKNTEFIFINVQAEGESDGYISTVANEIYSSVVKSDKNYKSRYQDMVRVQSMQIANRLMKELSLEFNDDIFIPYTPDLTVAEARGHIIIIEGDEYMYECRHLIPLWDGTFDDSEWLRASFYNSWPDNSVGWSSLYTYELTNDLRNSLYIQSMYEMKTDNLDRINAKKSQISALAKTVTSYNSDTDHKNVLGYNALNANTGSPTGLKTFAFAHEFNGYTYELYYKTMKDAKYKNATGLRCGIVPMDHYGARIFDNDIFITLYGDKLSWAIIESNFYNQRYIDIDVQSPTICKDN